MRFYQDFATYILQGHISACQLSPDYYYTRHAKYTEADFSGQKTLKLPIKVSTVFKNHLYISFGIRTEKLMTKKFFFKWYFYQMVHVGLEPTTDRL